MRGVFFSLNFLFFFPFLNYRAFTKCVHLVEGCQEKLGHWRHLFRNFKLASNSADSLKGLGRTPHSKPYLASSSMHTNWKTPDLPPTIPALEKKKKRAKERNMWFIQSCTRHSRNAVDSIRDAVLTVSPNRQYRGIVRPTTPATTGPTNNSTYRLQRLPP